MNRVLDRVDNRYTLCILGDPNGWIGDRVRVIITGAYGVLVENANDGRVVEFCAERRLCGGNTYFEHKSLRNYARVAWGQDGVEVKNMINLVLMKKDMLCYVQDARGMG